MTVSPEAMAADLRWMEEGAEHAEQAGREADAQSGNGGERHHAIAARFRRILTAIHSQAAEIARLTDAKVRELEGNLADEQWIAGDSQQCLGTIASECHAAGYATPDGTLLPMFREVAADAELGRAVEDAYSRGFVLADLCNHTAVESLSELVRAYRAYRASREAK